MTKSDKQGIELMTKNKNILNGLLVLLLSVLLVACGGGSSGGGNDSQNGAPPANEQESDTSNETDTENGGDNGNDNNNSGSDPDDDSGEPDDEIADSPFAVIFNNLKGPAFEFPGNKTAEMLIDENKVTLEVSREVFMPKNEDEMEGFVSSLGSNDSYIDLMDEEVAREAVDNILRKAFYYQSIFSLRIHEVEEDIIPINDLAPVESYRPNIRRYLMPAKAAVFGGLEQPLATVGTLLDSQEQRAGFLRLGLENDPNRNVVTSEPIVNCNDKTNDHPICQHGEGDYMKLTDTQTNSFYYRVPRYADGELLIDGGAAIIQPKKGWVASGAFLYPAASNDYQLSVFVDSGEKLEGEVVLSATLGFALPDYIGENGTVINRDLSYVAANVSIEEDVNLPVSPDGVQGRFLQKFKGTYIEPHKTFNTAVVMDVERATDENFYAYSIKGNGQFFYSRPVLNESGELEKDQEGWVSFEIEEPVFLSPNRGKMTISTSLASCEVTFNRFDADTISCHEL